MKKSVGIVGASGLVGTRLANLVAEKLDANIALFGNKSANSQMVVGNRRYKVLPIEHLLTAPLDIVGFCVDREISAQWIPQLTAKGVVCVDNSSYFRLQKGVPLIVPGVNDNPLPTSLLYANPNCTTIAVALALNKLTKYGLTSVNIVTMQATSGAGAGGLADLTEQNCYGKLKACNHPIYDNIIPQIEGFLPNGYTQEETKLQKELKKILCLPRLKVNSFCCRVPLTIGHCAVVTAKLSTNVNLEQIRKDLACQQNVLVLDNPSQNLYPMPTMVRQTKYVGVGRLVKVGAKQLNMFVVEDNLLRGAAYNALEIMQMVIEKCH